MMATMVFVAPQLQRDLVNIRLSMWISLYPRSFVIWGKRRFVSDRVITDGKSLQAAAILTDEESFEMQCANRPIMAVSYAEADSEWDSLCFLQVDQILCWQSSWVSIESWVISELFGPYLHWILYDDDASWRRGRMKMEKFGEGPAGWTSINKSLANRNGFLRGLKHPEFE